MDPRLLNYYNRELTFIREMGGEFAEEFPKIAGRLGLDSFECTDPYVERLLEGFAFLAARVQLKLDAQFPRFTQHLLEMVSPNYLAPTPSMAIVQLQPDLTEGGLADGFVVPRGSSLRSLLGKSDQTPCEYRTAHDVTLWPLEIVEADYFPRDAADVRLPDLAGVRAGLRVRLRATAGLTIDKIGLDELTLFLRSGDPLVLRLYEQLFTSAAALVVQPADPSEEWTQVYDKSQIGSMGFDDEQALLPDDLRSFQGYRLLHEYFAFPERYRFVRLRGIEQAVKRCRGAEVDLFVLFDQHDPALENRINATHLSLFCTPAINLFPKRADRVHLSDRDFEHHIVPDRTRPMDFEVYGIQRVTGHGTSAEEEQEFLPFYSTSDLSGLGEHSGFYSVRREPRVLSASQRQSGPRSSYIGSETFVALVDAREAPYRHDLRQLAVSALCTNRDLPLQMPIGQGRTDFTLQQSAPVDAVRCLAGPTRPLPSPCHAQGETAWRLISQLSLNYLSLSDTEQRGAAGLRELLKLYADFGQPHLQNQIEGVRNVTSEPVVRAVTGSGPISFGRGLEVTVTCDETAFEGSGIYLLGAVLDQFFAKYVSINSFTETVLRSVDRGEVMRWPAKIGRRKAI